MRLLQAGLGDPHERPALGELGDRPGADVEHRLPQPAPRAGGPPRRAGRGRRRDPRCPRAPACRRCRPRPGSSGPSSTTCARASSSRRASPSRGRTCTACRRRGSARRGVSSQPASSEPSMTVSAPATMAFAMSPEYCRPPSAISGTPAGLHASDASWIAVICGAPTPVTMRVVQIEPGPTPTFTASAPASTNACAPARVATLPPMTWTCRVAGSVFRPAHHVEQQPDVPVRGVGDEHVDAGLDEARRPLPRVTEVADRCADHQPAVRVLGTRSGTARTSRSP